MATSSPSGSSSPPQPPKVFDPEEEEFWQQHKTIKERIPDMWSSDFLADVVFLAGDKEEKIPAHKLLLCIASLVFARMFTGQLAQKTKRETISLGENCVEVVKVPDISPEAMKSLLKYIYAEKVELEMTYVFEVLYAALMYENEILIETCKEVIESYTKEVIQSDAFKNINEQTLGYILQMDDLQIEEWPLFQAVLKWADKECDRQKLALTPENKRKILGSSIYAIRFPAMKQKEFAEYANTNSAPLRPPNKKNATTDAIMNVLDLQVKTMSTITELVSSQDPDWKKACHEILEIAKNQQNLLSNLISLLEKHNEPLTEGKERKRSLIIHGNTESMATKPFEKIKEDHEKPCFEERQLDSICARPLRSSVKTESEMCM
uniref:BTB domain-containing protein n=1 Tax=Acrobeloides nanus TaxID=290746 RepID=A0A914E6V6_9BILA